MREFLPFQLIYCGKTTRCIPPYNFPSDWDITYSENYWSNESTMISYIDNVVAPFVARVREDLSVQMDQAALAIFDYSTNTSSDTVSRSTQYTVSISSTLLYRPIATFGHFH
jgi:hypothetical protein